LIVNLTICYLLIVYTEKIMEHLEEQFRNMRLDDSGSTTASTNPLATKTVVPSNGIFVFDTSGSMESTIGTAVKSFNTEILAGQKKIYEGAQDVDGLVDPRELFLVTIIQFSGKNNIQVVLKDVPISEIEPIPPNSLIADGMTALRTTIRFTDDLLSTLKYPKRKTMIFFFTDGEDTDSRMEDTHDVIKKIFERYEKSKSEDPDHSISATLIGSNQDAVTTGGSLGLPKGSALTYQDDAVGSAMTSVGRILSRVATGYDSTPLVTDFERVESCPSAHSSHNGFEMV
jgi:uncharacterized protein YegL